MGETNAGLMWLPRSQLLVRISNATSAPHPRNGLSVRNSRSRRLSTSAAPPQYCDGDRREWRALRLPWHGQPHDASDLGIGLPRIATKAHPRLRHHRLGRSARAGKGAGEAGRTVRRLSRTGPLIPNELGQPPFSPSGGALLCHPLSKRCERTGIAITAKPSCRARVDAIDNRMTTALVDCRPCTATS